MSRPRRAAVVHALIGALVLAGCGSNDPSSGSSSSKPATVGAGLGPVKKAAGKPVVFGMLNLEAGPVTFPESRQAAAAAAAYLNEHAGGIDGRPIKIETCATDGQPSTSARCANQLLDKHPVAIIGGADTGAPGAIPVYEKASLPYLGGIPFTPVESNAPNAVEFISVAGGDLAASVEHVSKQGAKKLAVIYTDDTQGKADGLGVIKPVGEQLGMKVKTVPVAPSAPDLASVAAAAAAGQPDAIFLDSPNACPGLMKALKAIGSQAQLLGIDVCVSPPALNAAGDATEGLIFAQPFPSLDSGDKDTQLFLAAVKKFGEKKLVLDSISQAAFASVMNVHATLDELGGDGLKSDAILAAFKQGKDHDNFMAHPYTCDGKALAPSRSVCNAHQIIKQYKNGKVVAVDGDTYVSAAQFIR